MDSEQHIQLTGFPERQNVRKQGSFIYGLIHILKPSFIYSVDAVFLLLSYHSCLCFQITQTPYIAQTITQSPRAVSAAF